MWWVYNMNSKVAFSERTFIISVLRSYWGLRLCKLNWIRQKTTQGVSFPLTQHLFQTNFFMCLSLSHTSPKIFSLVFLLKNSLIFCIYFNLITLQLGQLLAILILLLFSLSLLLFFASVKRIWNKSKIWEFQKTSFAVIAFRMWRSYREIP